MWVIILKGMQKPFGSGKTGNILCCLCIIAAFVVMSLRICFPAETKDFADTVLKVLEGDSNFRAVGESVRAWLKGEEDTLPAFQQIVSEALGMDVMVVFEENGLNGIE